MYVDDGSSNDDGDIKVDVGGEEYTAEANVDLDEDGIADAVAIHTDTGTTVYADTDHDGVADEYAELDAQGHVTTEAHFDAGSHEWVDSGNGGGTGSDTGSQANTGGGDDIHVDTPQGDVDAGHATVDSNNDGVADTAVVDDGHGGKILVTDSNGDGQADVLTQVSKDGEVTVSEHSGHGQWTVEEHGHIDSSGHYQKDSLHGAANVDMGSDAVWGGQPNGVEGVARIDATTGQWISRN